MEFSDSNSSTLAARNVSHFGLKRHNNSASPKRLPFEEGSTKITKERLVVVISRLF